MNRTSPVNVGSGRHEQQTATEKTGTRQGRPPAIWIGYGRLVKHFRELAGLTQPQLADLVGYSVEQTSSIEQGRRGAKSAFTEAAEPILNAKGALKALQEQVDLARLPLFLQDFAAMEADALSYFWYGGYVVPGLLQTEDYARTLLTEHFPPLDEPTVEKWVEGRMERQVVLARTKPPLVVVFIIEEAVLERPVGGPEIMKAQLDHLLEASQRRNVEIQIMPTSFGAHSGLNGTMVMLETTDHHKVAYVESQDESIVISDPDKVSNFWLRYGMLRSQALNTEKSVHLMREARARYEH